MSPSTWSLAIGGGAGICLWTLLLAYNVVAGVRFLREGSEGSASPLSRAAWALGFVSVFLGPCMWLAAGIALGMARIERRRIYDERSTLASVTPVRLATINAGVTLAIFSLWSAAAVITALL